MFVDYNDCRASNLVIDVIVEDYEACYIDVYRNCKSSREKTLTVMSDNEVIELKNVMGTETRHLHNKIRVFSCKI